MDKRQLELCNKAAEAIEAAFVWKESAEGFDFWSNVYQKLKYKAIGETK